MRYQIKTIVNWQQEHTLVKTAFPLTLNSDFTTYEIACGAIERSHEPESPKWEVYGHKWADLTDTEANYGVSLLNNNKYGYDATNQQLRLTLLRSPRWPDAEADLGKQEFTQLGSGYQLATRDLEIRGAGNLGQVLTVLQQGLASQEHQDFLNKLSQKK